MHRTSPDCGDVNSHFRLSGNPGQAEGGICDPIRLPSLFEHSSVRFARSVICSDRLPSLASAPIRVQSRRGPCERRVSTAHRDHTTLTRMGADGERWEERSEKYWIEPNRTGGVSNKWQRNRITIPPSALTRIPDSRNESLITANRRGRPDAF